ncbi:hypothetical protein B0H16DRAFT_1704513 [Mycena metata]|uniref:Uncharacterized protein n=1 Tax=Mycena metata TaxID=1033252 RepID=A0AAD7M8K4_9AGAR|nr:hypothetical protein B0H16DRAFT_1704513 [Mycena metata]
MAARGTLHVIVTLRVRTTKQIGKKRCQKIQSLTSDLNELHGRWSVLTAKTGGAAVKPSAASNGSLAVRAPLQLPEESTASGSRWQSITLKSSAEKRKDFSYSSADAKVAEKLDCNFWLGSYASESSSFCAQSGATAESFNDTIDLAFRATLVTVDRGGWFRPHLFGQSNAYYKSSSSSSASEGKSFQAFSNGYVIKIPGPQILGYMIQKTEVDLAAPIPAELPSGFLISDEDYANAQNRHTPGQDGGGRGEAVEGENRRTVQGDGRYWFLFVCCVVVPQIPGITFAVTNLVRRVYNVRFENLWRDLISCAEEATCSEDRLGSWSSDSDRVLARVAWFGGYTTARKKNCFLMVGCSATQKAVEGRAMV